MVRWMRSIGALAVLVVLLVGVPLLLSRVAGRPFPQQALDLDHMGRMVRQGEIPGDVVVKSIALVVWIAWVQVVWAVLWEVAVNGAGARAGRQRRAPFVPRPLAVGVARLVAAVLAAGIVAGGPSPAMATTLPSVSVDVGGLIEPAIGPASSPGYGWATSSPVTVAAHAPRWHVGDRDTLWEIAERALGDGTRVGELLDLNPQLGSVRGLRAGQVLTMPAGAAIPAERAQSALKAYAAVRPAAGHATETAVRTQSAAPAPHPNPTGAVEYVAVEGDTLWDILDTRYGYVDADLVWAVAGYNDMADPGVLMVGDVVVLPDLPIPERSRPAPPPSPMPPRVDPDVDSIRVDTPPVRTDRSGPPARPSPAAEAGRPAMRDVLADGLPVTPSAPTPAAVTPSTTTTAPSGVANDEPADGSMPLRPTSPSPIGLGEAGFISAGIVALLTARRRARMRAARSMVRLPEPPPGVVAVERSLRMVDAGDRLMRVDVAIRAAAAELLTSTARVSVVQAARDGVVTVTFTEPVTLPAPWIGARSRWAIPGSTPVELLAGRARTVGGPCVALVQLGVDEHGADVLVDLEALGSLSVHAEGDLADDVVRALAAGLASSVFAESAPLFGVGLAPGAFLGRSGAVCADSLAHAVEEADGLVAIVPPARNTFELRARHTSGETWEPGVILAAGATSGAADAAAMASARDGRRALALVVAGSSSFDADVDAVVGEWQLRAQAGCWRLDPLGLRVTPVGLSAPELQEVESLVVHTGAAPVDEISDPIWSANATAETGQGSIGTESGQGDGEWTLMLRVLGPVELVDRSFNPAVFSRSKPLELVAWLGMNRDRPTRRAARNALWELDVRDATFANVVSDARRAMRELATAPDGDDWLGRTSTDRLPLHRSVVTDADVVRACLVRARVEPPEQAIATLRPAVELIRDLPFAGAGYLWPDAEGVTSTLVLLATSAASELAAQYLTQGDIDGVFWATGRGLVVLPGHEELISLRMRAHAHAGDLAGVRAEWESYERVITADLFCDGEPASKLVDLRRQLLSS